jgi:serine-type D-Ala-D-Ala carboxypeptidase/endopeptidase (penicillin-binding protein 4)
MRQIRSLPWLSFLMLVLFLPACAARYSARVAAKASADSVPRLQADLEKIFSEPVFSGAQWGVEVYSLDRSERLYDKNSARLYIPASNNKIITVAVALLCLGPDYHFVTRVLTNGPITNGVLKGDLFVIGSGDPALSPRFEPGPFGAFIHWAEKLKEQRIVAISGDLVGVGGAFEETMLGTGWEWNDLDQAYAAPVSALQFNDNIVTLEIAPGAEIGSPASIKTTPLPSYPDVENSVSTAAPGTPVKVRVKYANSHDSMRIQGSVPAKGNAYVRPVAVQAPVRYYLTALKQTLANEGIDASTGSIKEMRTYNGPPLSELWSHSSPPLSEIIRPVLKLSINLYAETLTRTLGLAMRGEGSFDEGAQVVEDTLKKMGIDKGRYNYADGSGLSRLNLVSAEVLVRILEFIHRNQYFPFFYDALPVAGLDGTLAARLKGTRAEDNLHAKTGSMANVSTISGYMRTRDGEMLALSIMANNFVQIRDKVERAQDRALERLANFSRK